MKDATRSHNPYPGLRPFQFSESHLFFGRERQGEELLRKLRRNRFLAVVGTSGSGKSSLVRAGLLPLLERGFAADAGTRWRIALFRPGKNPINNMALALNSPEAFKSPNADGDRGAAQTDAQESSQLRAAVIETMLRRSALGLADHARRSTDGARENLLVCVDQFEELFRFKEQSQRSNPEDEAAAFVKLLLEAARDKGVAVYVLLTMRSDFLGECSQFRDLPEAINEGQYLIPRMTREEQRDAIAEPAASCGAELTPRLVQRLLNDMGDNPDQLPLLQHALMRTWDHWVEGKGVGLIDLDHYKAIGGMEKALSNHAQQTYDALPDEQSRKITEKLFKALTETVLNNREIRRPAEMQEICAITEAKPAEVISVIDHFRHLGRSFLMPPPGTALTAETVIDISHESLIKGWDLLKRWVEEEAKSKVMYQRIANAAKRRYKEEEGGASLWRDPDLKFALEWKERVKPNEAWAQRYDPQFKEAMDFLKESEEDQKRELAERERRLNAEREREERERQLELKNAQDAALYQQKVAEAERQRAVITERFARRLKFALAAIVAMFLLATGLAIYAFKQRSHVKESAVALAAALKVSQQQTADKEVARRVAEAATVQAQDERQKANEAKQKAVEASAVAEEAKNEAETQKKLALKKAGELQTTLNTLRSTEEGRKRAQFREDAERKGLIALEKGDVVDAVENFEVLRDHYAQDPSNKSQEAWSWANYNLGTAYRQAKLYHLAAHSYALAVNKQKSIFSQQSPEIIPALKKLAQVYYEQNNYQEADKAYQELSGVLQKLVHSKANNELIISVKSEMAKLFQDEAKDINADASQKSEELDALLSKVRDLRTRAASEPPTAKQPDDLKDAQLQASQLEDKIKELKESVVKKYAEAEGLYKEVVANRENFLPEIHPDLIGAYNALAAFYQDRALAYEEEKFFKKEAEAARASANDLYKLARVIRVNRLNSANLDEAEAKKIETVADAYREMKKYEPSEKLLGKSLEIRRILASKEIYGDALAGQPSLSLASTLAYLTMILHEDHRDAEAKPIYDELLKDLDKIVSKPGTEVKWNDEESPVDTLITFLHERKSYAEAASILERTIALREKTLPNTKDKESKAERAEVAEDITERFEFLGSIKYMQKDYPAAVKALNDGIALIRKEFAQNSDSDYSLSLALAKIYSEQGRDEKALPLFQRVQAIFGKMIGPEQRIPGQGRRNFIEIEITDSYSMLPGPGYYLEALGGLATLYSRRGENQEAEPIYREWLRASEWVFQNRQRLSSFSYSPEEIQNYKKLDESRYADALESYAAFLKKPEVNRAAEAKPLEERAAEIRRRLGPKKESNTLLMQ